MLMCRKCMIKQKATTNNKFPMIARCEICKEIHSCHDI